MTSNHQELNNHHLQYYHLNGSIEECDNYIHSDDYGEDDDDEDDEDDTNSSPLTELQIYDNSFNNKRNTALSIGDHHCGDDNILPLMSNGNTTTVTSIDWGSVLSLSSSNSNNNGNNSQSTSSTSITLMNNIDGNCDDITTIISTTNIDRKSQQHKRRRRHYKHHYHHSQIHTKHRHHHSHHHQRSQKRRERGVASSPMPKNRSSSNYQVLS